MPKIRFTKGYVFKTSPAWITYNPGDVHSGDVGFCEKFIRRGVAEYAEVKPDGEPVPDEIPDEGTPTVKRGRKPSGA